MTYTETDKHLTNIGNLIGREAELVQHDNPDKYVRYIWGEGELSITFGWHDPVVDVNLGGSYLPLDKKYAVMGYCHYHTSLVLDVSGEPECDVDILAKVRDLEYKSHFYNKGNRD